MQIFNHPSPNRTSGRQGQIPDFIVCHITGGSYSSAINTITNPTSQVSYHFVISHDGMVARSVDISDTAWANGTTINGDNRDNQHSTIPEVRSRRRNANQYTISIGFADSTAGELSHEQLITGVDLLLYILAYVRDFYGLDIPLARTNIIGHHEITPITRPFCPGLQFPFDDLITQAREMSPHEHQNKVILPVTSPNAPSPWAKEAWNWGTHIGLTDGTNPQGIPTREQMITLLHRYHLAGAEG